MRRGRFVICLLLLPGCWADFPESRFPGDGPVQDWTTSADVSRVDRYRADTQRLDARPLDRGEPCTPDAFIRCASNSQLERCNSTGDGTVLISCGASSCAEDLQRCTQCAPTDPAHCVGTDLVTCNGDGLEVRTPCPLGCSGAACCVDGDKDGKTDCDGDCNDANPDIFPGQQSYFTTSSAGSFDYDCSNTEDLQYSSTVDCDAVGPSCKGEGWLATPVPGCGVQGTFVTCVKQGSQCKPEESNKTQGCH